MSGRVVFEADANDVFRKPPVRSTEQRFVDRGITHSVVSSKLLLVFLAAGLIGGAFYFLISAIPETPQLGADILRSGEKIPTNRSI